VLSDAITTLPGIWKNLRIAALNQKTGYAKSDPKASGHTQPTKKPLVSIPKHLKISYF
jgi:hypothetical protein